MTDEVLFSRIGEAGIITLNRPQALNALTLAMVRAMRPQLEAWASDPAITRVLVEGAGEKAFCAGGDIRALHDAGKEGRKQEALAFWREEYELNMLIHRYPKPYVALIDGIVMGGGVGVSINGRYTVAGEKFTFAMPEVGIGFFPDVGGSYFLSRLPDEIGTYLALTANRLKQGDALAIGLVQGAVKSADFPALRQALCAGDVAATLQRFASHPPPSVMMAERDTLKKVFAAGCVEDILKALDAAARNADPWCADTAKTMRSKSPTSMKIALEQLRRGKDMTFEQAMQMEFRIVSRIADGHDFYEGVRAVIIDKDFLPRWQPSTLDGVSRPALDAYFAPLAGHELHVPATVAQWLRNKA